MKSSSYLWSKMMRSQANYRTDNRCQNQILWSTIYHGLQYDMSDKLWIKLNNDSICLRLNNTLKTRWLQIYQRQEYFFSPTVVTADTDRLLTFLLTWTDKTDTQNMRCTDRSCRLACVTHRGSWCVRRAQILLDVFHYESGDASSTKTKSSL